ARKARAQQVEPIRITSPRRPAPRQVPEGFGTARDCWELWWRHNQVPILELRQRTRSVVHACFRDRIFDSSETSGRLSFEDLRDLIVPGLISAAGDADQSVASAAVTALASVVPREHASLALDAILLALRHPAVSVREAAALALGVLGDPSACEVLGE